MIIPLIINILVLGILATLSAMIDIYYEVVGLTKVTLALKLTQLVGIIALIIVGIDKLIILGSWFN